MRIGIGYDAHKLVAMRDLILGGIKVPFEKGLLGHSDADVLTHAVIDSLLGAMALGDIGRHFPDSDERYKGVSSMKLLEEVMKMLRNQSCRIVNIDCVLIMERPKIFSFIPAITENYCRCMNLDRDQINIKATTEEGMGFTGKGEGIAAKAVCLIEKI